jgi:hypothetical protein
VKDYVQGRKLVENDVQIDIDRLSDSSVALKDTVRATPAAVD